MRTLLLMAILVALLSGLSSIAVADPPKAVVLTGDVEGSETACANTAAEVESDFEDAGYNVSSDATATEAEAIAAISDPDVQAVCIISHGDPEIRKGKPKEYREGVKMADGEWLDASDFPPNNTFPNVKEVIIHACGQDQQSWRDLFPNAKFYSWQGSTKGFIIFWWQYFYTATPPGEEPLENGIPIIHPSLWSRITYESGGRTVAPFGNLQDPLFQMPWELAIQFGEKTFNVIARDDENLSDTVLLVGAVVEDGHVLEYNYEGYVSPDFEVIIPKTPMFNSLECPASVFSYEGIANGIEIYNYSSTPSAVLFRGFALVHFGVIESCSEPPDTCGCEAQVIPTITPDPMYAIFPYRIVPIPGTATIRSDELPEGYDATDINALTLTLNDSVISTGAFTTPDSLDMYFDARDFVRTYGLIWGVAYLTYAVSGEFNDGVPFSLEYPIVIIGHRSGDANLDGDVNVADAVFIINYIFSGGDAPMLAKTADANCDGKVNVGDAIRLINYIFRGDTEPCH
jgi:hypothetical protein